MNPEHIALDRAEAHRLWRKYKEHRAYSEPIDWEIQRAYQLLARGKLIIRALESIVRGGLNSAALPKLAIASASGEICYLTRFGDGSCAMSLDKWGRRKNQTHRWRAETFTFPPDSFPFNWNRTARVTRSDHQAQVPLVPLHLRPRRGLQNYHVLWEAEWRPEPPRDPYLLRRIGKADLWLVVAHWELTDVERAALATRIIP